MKSLPVLRAIRYLLVFSALAGLVASEIAAADAPEFFNGDCYCCNGPPTLFRWYCSEEEGGPPGLDEPLASDRPDFVEASTTVGRGVRQLEMGYTYFYDDDGGANRTFGSTYPEFLFRVGVFADWLELRVGWTYSNVTERSVGVSNTFNGSEDIYLGLKLGLTPQDGILPEMALVPQMTVPTGHRDFTTDNVLPGFNLLYGWDINDFLSFAGSTAANMAIDDGTTDEYLEFAQAFTIGYTLTEKVGAYMEWFMITPSGAETVRTQHYFDGGFIYRVTNNLQLDVRAGKGVSAGADDYFVGSGAVVRW